VIESKEEYRKKKMSAIARVKWLTPEGDRTRKSLSRSFKKFWNSEEGHKARKRNSRIMKKFHKDTSYAVDRLHDILMADPT